MIKRPDREDFDKVYRLMEISFPKDEYRTYDEQKKLLDDPAYGIYILPDPASDGIIAFMAAWEFDSFFFIEHLAVDPAYRNGGVGGNFLREAIGSFGKPTCLEVEPPDNETASRRIKFYERNGFFLNEYPYIQPAISRGRNLIPLLIMTTGRRVDDEEYEKIKETLYARVYKQTTEQKGKREF